MTYLGTWSTYYIVSGTSTGNSNGDAYGGFAVYYEYEPTNLRYKIQVNSLLRRKPTYENSDPSKPYYVPDVSGYIKPTINGTTGTQVSFNKSGYYKANSSNVDTNISTQYFYVPINQSDGTASVSLSGKFYGTLYGGLSATRTCSHTWSLPTVSVGSAITNNTSSSSRIEFGNNVTFTITPPSGSSYTHTLKYTVNNTEYTIASDSSLTTIAYTFPTSLISDFTDNGTPSITVNCIASNNVTTTTEVFLQVPDTDTYRPTVNISLADLMENKPVALSGLWIKNKSLLQGTITATAKLGANISSYLSSLSDFSTTYNTNPFTTQALTISGSRTITYQATDSRGLSKSGTQSINVIDYNNPAIISAKVERCLQDGTLDESGSYGKATVNYNVYPLNDGNNDLNTISLTVKKGSGTAQTITTSSYSGTVSQVFNFSLTETSTDTFTFELTDIFGSVSYEFTLGTSYITVSKRAGGKGIAFGKVATQDGFDCNMDAIFRQNVQYKNYSTTEKAIGLWVDDKILYRKTYQITGDNTNSQTLATLSGIDSIVNIQCFATKNNYVRNCTTAYYGSDAWTSQVYYYNGDVILECGNNFKDFKNTADICLTIEYTKLV